MSWKIEVTDTFGGEANYCWVRRYTLPNRKFTPLALIRAAKKLISYNGVRCAVENYGDFYELRPYGECVVIFLQWEDE